MFIDEYLQLPTLEEWDRMSTAMMYAIKRVLKLIDQYAKGSKSYMNMVLTDGHLAVAVRLTTDKPEYADSLYLNLGRKYVCEEGICYMHDPGEQHEKAVIISSEPLSKDVGWEEIPPNSMILVQEGKIREKMTINLNYL